MRELNILDNSPALAPRELLTSRAAGGMQMEAALAFNCHPVLGAGASVCIYAYAHACVCLIKG